MTRTRPGRTGRDGGVQWAKALVLIVVLVAVGVAILKDSDKHSSSNPVASSHTTTTRPTSSTTTPASTTTTTLLPASEVKVLVLNGANPAESLAGEWSVKLRNKGYTTEPPANATATVSASAIYVVTPGYQAEAQALAAAVGDPDITIDQTVGAGAPVTAAERTSANLILVVGPDLAATA